MGFTQENTNNITVIRAHKYEKDNKVTVFFDMTVNSVSIYGCKFMTGSKGDFVALPQTKTGDKWYNIVWVKLTDDDIKNIENQCKALIDIQ